MSDIGYAHLAIRSTHPKHKHVALLFSEGEIIAWANNTEKLHAEVRLIMVGKMLGVIPGKNITLISIAIDKAGKLKLAKPCVRCMSKIKASKIEHVLWSTKQQLIVKHDRGL